MVEIKIFDPFTRAMSLILIFTLFLLGISYMIRGIFKREITYEKRKILYAVACLFIGLGFLELFFFCSDYFVKGYYKKHSFYGDYDDYYPLYELMGLLALITVLVGNAFFIFFTEHNFESNRIAKYKPVFIFNVFLVFLIIFINYNDFANLRNNLYLFAGSFNAVYIFTVLFYIAIDSSENLDIIAASLLFCALLIILGLYLDSKFIKERNFVYLWVPAFLILSGSTSTIIPIIFGSTRKTRFKVLMWAILIAHDIVMIFFSFFFLWITNPPLHFLLIFWVGVFLYFLIIAFSIYRLKKIYNSLYILESPSQKRDPKNILDAFQSRHHLHRNYGYSSEDMEDIVKNLKKKITLAIPILKALYNIHRKNKNENYVNIQTIKDELKNLTYNQGTLFENLKKIIQKGWIDKAKHNNYKLAPRGLLFITAYFDMPSQKNLP